MSVTRLIGEFKRDGLVRENGLQLVDCDRLRLARLAGGASGASGASVTGDAGEPSAATDEGGPDSAGSLGGAAAARVGRAPAGRLDDQVVAAARES